jgi:hypothetical protein
MHPYVAPRPAATPVVAHLRSTLGVLYKVAVTDGRVFEGRLVCIDKVRCSHCHVYTILNIRIAGS